MQRFKVRSSHSPAFVPGSKPHARILIQEPARRDSVTRYLPYDAIDKSTDLQCELAMGIEGPAAQHKQDKRADAPQQPIMERDSTCFACPSSPRTSKLAHSD